jgi:hypothetical protein
LISNLTVLELLVSVFAGLCVGAGIAFVAYRLGRNDERSRVLRILIDERAHWDAVGEDLNEKHRVAISIGATGALANVYASVFLGRDIRAKEGGAG